MSKQQVLENNPLLPAFPRINSYQSYYSLLERGVAIHHASLPLALKNETEKRIYAGQIRLLFTSPTLAQGVNMPFDVVLIYRLQHSHQEPIQPTTFWNVVGRVGRPMGGATYVSPQLYSPHVIFLNNTDRKANDNDKMDIYISRKLLSEQKKYHVGSPF
ncbi:MAG: hypothetical protein IPL28_21870 [Chloroflexi bacterium]|nr:hypothetical protein [Chloroflexota bacterium]